MGKKYKIPVSWQMYGYMDIEAEDWDEAIEIANDDATSLPSNADYVDGSFEVDHDIIEFEREEEADKLINRHYNTLKNLPDDTSK